MDKKGDGKKDIPILMERRRIQVITKRFPWEVEYGDAVDPASYTSSCVFVVDVDASSGSVVLEDCRTGESFLLSSEESARLGLALVRAGKAVEKI